MAAQPDSTPSAAAQRCRLCGNLNRRSSARVGIYWRCRHCKDESGRGTLNMGPAMATALVQQPDAEMQQRTSRRSTAQRQRREREAATAAAPVRRKRTSAAATPAVPTPVPASPHPDAPVPTPAPATPAARRGGLLDRVLYGADE